MCLDGSVAFLRTAASARSREIPPSKVISLSQHSLDRTIIIFLFFQHLCLFCVAAHTEPAAVREMRSWFCERLMDKAYDCALQEFLRAVPNNYDHLYGTERLSPEFYLGFHPNSKIIEFPLWGGADVLAAIETH